MSTLVFLEHHGGELQKGSLAVLSKAASLGGDVAGVIVGSGLGGLADQAAKYGAATVYVADDPKLEAPLPQPRVDAIAQLVAETGNRDRALRRSRSSPPTSPRVSRPGSTPGSTGS